MSLDAAGASKRGLGMGMQRERCHMTSMTRQINPGDRCTVEQRTGIPARDHFVAVHTDSWNVANFVAFGLATSRRIYLLQRCVDALREAFPLLRPLLSLLAYLADDVNI